MARTRRSKTSQNLYFRNPKTKKILTDELHAAVELQEAGYTVTPRHQKRANPTSRQIPTAHDDIRVAASFEWDHKT